jgi:hypothetical protein
MSNHVFVSHSHEDSSAADLIVKALEERSVVCWIAPRDVEAGGSYAESIIDAIENACCFVLIYSKSSNVSSHVMREVERALKFGVNIVPVRFDDSTPSKSLDYLLATVHWLAIAPDQRDRSVVRAAEQILAVVAKSQRTSAAAAPNRPAPSIAAPVVAPPKRGPLWIGAAVALALVAGFIWFFVSRNSSFVQSAQKSEVAASASAASSTTSAPATAQIDDAELPVAVTHRYFDFLSKRDATDASNLLSEDFRRRLSKLYFKNVSTLPRAKLVEATLVSKNERTASVTAVFEDANPESHQRRWRGPIEFVHEPGGWRIESMKGLIPASGHLLPDSANETGGDTAQDINEPAPQSAGAPASTALSHPGQQQAMYGIVQDPEGSAKVREEPLGHSKFVTMLKNGRRVEIDRFEGIWAHIIIGPNQSGFILKNHLNIIPEKP